MKSKAALLIIDPQVNMFDEDLSVYQGQQQLRRYNELAGAARQQGCPVIFVRNNGGQEDPDAPHTPGWEIHPALTPAENDWVLDKTTPDTFAGTDLGQRLTARHIDTLVICGMQTEFCVTATWETAVALGYRVILVADGHTTFDFPDEPPAAEIIARFNQTAGEQAIVQSAADITFS